MLTETNANKAAQEYKELYQKSLSDDFWKNEAMNHLDWQEPFTKVLEGSFELGWIKWFSDGYLNACYNCVDRHAIKTPSKVALMYEGDEPDLNHNITYKELLHKVCKLANYLKSINIKKGDVVAIYLPMIPECVISMLACARIGAIHNIIFSGFSSNALNERIEKSNAKILITSNEAKRGGKTIDLKNIVNNALTNIYCIKKVIVVQRTSTKIDLNPQLDILYTDATKNMSTECECEKVSAEDPLFILYTSGSTGRPKGIVHTTGGYLLGAAVSLKHIFDINNYDRFGCTADVGWITGHTYCVYGPLCIGISTLIFESVPVYPNEERYWSTIDKLKLTQLYTSPTAIRLLKTYGVEPIKKYSLDSLRVLGTVGEPIDPQTWKWFYENVGKNKCAFVDTYWQTETGSIIMSCIPNKIAPKPGSAALPFLGIKPHLIQSDNNNLITKSYTQGALVISQPWPSICRTIFNNKDRYIDAYLSKHKGYYLTGDGAEIDEDKYFWIKGRLDDVINISGHRLSTAEIEAAINKLNNITENAVIGIPDSITGECVFAYVVVNKNEDSSNELKTINEIKKLVRENIGPFATPKHIIISSFGLPKTRSGKIMRRLLRKIATNNTDLGDISTLANPEVVTDLIAKTKL